MKFCYDYMGQVAADSRQRVALHYDVTTVMKNTVCFEKKNITNLGFGKNILHNVINIYLENRRADIE
jgi:hypothetical protein